MTTLNIPDLLKDFIHDVQSPLITIKMGALGIKDFLPQLIAAYQIACASGLIEAQIQPRHIELLTKVLNNIESATNDIDISLNSFASKAL